METDDIGNYSIISPLHPYAGKGPQRDSPSKSTAKCKQILVRRPIKEHGRINERLGIDDRKRLPSYGRDAVSDTASLYPSHNWMSRSQIMGIADARCYSMTHTPANSDLPLVNRKSFTSLRSQMDPSQQQRPKPPFVYPKRLKRPGFRPTSPLVARGRVGYGGRAEIEMLPNVSGAKRSCPSSFYANPKVPAPLSIRSDVNWSDHSLFGFSSSPCRPSVSARARTNDFDPKYTSRNNTPGRPSWPSPAKSSCSSGYAPTFYCHGPLRSKICTPAQRLPPSPLYYDYTEEFEPDDTSTQSNVTVENLTLPSFSVKGIIHEDTELSSDRSSPMRKEMHKLNEENGKRRSLDYHVSYSDALNEHDIFTGSMEELETPNVVPLSTLIRTSHSVKRCLDEEEKYFANMILTNDPEYRQMDTSQSSVAKSEDPRDKLARGLSADIHRVPGPSEPVDVDCILSRSSSNSLYDHLPKFPKPPDGKDAPFQGFFRSSTASGGHGQQENSLDNYFFDTKKAGDCHMRDENGPQNMFRTNRKPENIIRERSTQSVSTHERRSQASQFCSIDRGMADLTIMIHEIERVKSQIPQMEKLFPDSLVPQIQGMSLPHNPQPTFLGIEKGDLKQAPRKMQEGDHVAFRETHCGSKNEHKHGKDGKAHVTIPNFSHQIRISPSPTNLAVIAPKPISPARELRLKQSVPLHMKALPPIPTGESVNFPSPPSPSVAELPFNFAPMLPNKQHLDWLFAHEGKENCAPVTNSISLHLSSQTSDDWITSLQPLSTKFKLKSRSGASNGPLSVTSSSPWNASENPHGIDQLEDVSLPYFAGRGQLTTPRKSQKLKLRVTKSSSSSFGTVRINKAARNHVADQGLDPRYPKDLFTSPSDLTSIFRQVSTHFNPRKKSASGESVLPIETQDMVPNKRPDSIQRPQQVRSVLFASQAAQPGLVARTPNEVRSFFSDDSSQIEENRGLRKRLSNLRARISVPYGSRPREGQTWEDSAKKRGIGRFIPNKRQFRSSKTLANMGERQIPSNDSRKFKKKVLCWFKDTQIAVKGYAKGVHHEKESCSLMR